ncbi:hypothetical protein [Streptomyces sp. NPDC050564]|uniref:hypothetical protein n=1 Tax=Streptomyces sp. NPDC050564 TaxID=3365631 RepID=UPI00378F618B
MIVGVVIFAVLGAGMIVAQMIKRRWVPCLGLVLNLVGVEAGYASIIWHQVWLTVSATFLLLTASAVMWRDNRQMAARATAKEPEPS